MRTRIKNIKSLLQIENAPRKRVCGADMAHIDHIENAYLIVEDDRIATFGPMCELKEQTFDKEVDATGRMVMPSFCDSHTHLVYAGSREIEYIDKIRGLSYDEIAKRGGGILNSAKRVQEASEEQLYDDAMARLRAGEQTAQSNAVQPLRDRHEPAGADARNMVRAREQSAEADAG